MKAKTNAQKKSVMTIRISTNTPVTTSIMMPPIAQTMKAIAMQKARRLIVRQGNRGGLVGVICFRGRQRSESNNDAAHEEETGEGDKGIEGYIHL